MSDREDQTKEESQVYQAFDLTYISYLESLSQQNPNEIPQDWRDLIQSQKISGQIQRPAANGAGRPNTSITGAPSSRNDIMLALKAIMLIRAYRVRGHLASDLDPLKITTPMLHPELDPATYGLDKNDNQTKIYLDGALGFSEATPKEIYEKLQSVYCSRIGLEYMHIQDPEKKHWIQSRFESTQRPFPFTKKEKTEILRNLICAESFEKFLNIKFPGAKRFGLEGGESTVPALEVILQTAANDGVNEVVLGMAHRGRLSILANVMKKPMHLIFSKFQGNEPSNSGVHGSGDVKYHLGFSSNRHFAGHDVHLSLTANPSHLEAVNPVVLGKVRAKQHICKDHKRATVMGILLHGDAAFAGQGLVAETLELSDLKGYRTGGTIHIIINNQIGFTTSPPHSRSSPYSSDIAKAIQAPILHVNGDDPESVCWAAKFVTEYKQTYGQDVILDIYCYRRHGHNEMDEPFFTQPIMYKVIAKHPSTQQLYSQKLIEEGSLTQQEVSTLRDEVDKNLKEQFEEALNNKEETQDWLKGNWAGIKFHPSEDYPVTGISEDKAKFLAEKLYTIPQEFNAHPKIIKQWQARKDNILSETKGMDWATAESLAFGSLLDEGYLVRLSGQDCGRGTFSQRHAVLVDQVNEDEFISLQHIHEKQGMCEILNSPLAEASVLGFEYGYSSANPRALVMWEGQFGDFANGAQVIIDQFISAAEVKWLRLSGVVLLLPHGYEGQGPEHSSARLERYLQLSAENNWYVANCTTPANYFHILRRQIHSDVRKPLILMTPKSLLRHPLAVSPITEMTGDKRFQPILPTKLGESNQVNRVIFCSGKVYYDVYQKAQKQGLEEILIVRLEELYPFPSQPILNLLNQYTGIQEATYVWCQEEPANMGAWTFIDRRLEKMLKEMGIESPVQYAGRKAAAATATGFASRHSEEQEGLVCQALGLEV